MAQIRNLNRKVTEPVSGHMKTYQAVIVLIVNLVLPGIGTVMIGCFTSNNIFRRNTVDRDAS